MSDVEEREPALVNALALAGIGYKALLDEIGDVRALHDSADADVSFLRTQVATLTRSYEDAQKRSYEAREKIQELENTVANAKRNMDRLDALSLDCHRLARALAEVRDTGRTKAEREMATRLVAMVVEMCAGDEPADEALWAWVNAWRDDEDEDF